MYFSVFQSSEYHSDEDTNNDNENNKVNNDDDNCIICWTPDNQLQLLSDIPNIVLNCNCNPKIHQTCLNNWLVNTRSCPICRKDIVVNIPLNMSLKIRSFINRYIQCLFKIYFCILAINLFIIVIDITSKK